MSVAVGDDRPCARGDFSPEGWNGLTDAQPSRRWFCGRFRRWGEAMSVCRSVEAEGTKHGRDRGNGVRLRGWRDPPSSPAAGRNAERLRSAGFAPGHGQSYPFRGRTQLFTGGGVATWPGPSLELSIKARGIPGKSLTNISSHSLTPPASQPSQTSLSLLKPAHHAFLHRLLCPCRRCCRLRRRRPQYCRWVGQPKWVKQQWVGQHKCVERHGRPGCSRQPRERSWHSPFQPQQLHDRRLLWSTHQRPHYCPRQL
jgi:hypothetical protein